MSFRSPEIDCIHPMNQAFSYETDWEKFKKEGIITVATKDFGTTTTPTQEFMVDDKRVYVSFGITRSISTKIGEPPLSLHSSMMFDFEPTKAIEALLASSSGKLKSIYKFLKNLIKANSLQSEIVQMGKDFDDIVGVFGRQLYKTNGEELEYSDMGQRLSEQRNNFAHGNLDQDFIGAALLDLVFLQYILYAMQLKHYGVEDKNIQQAINDLFQCRIAL